MKNQQVNQLEQNSVHNQQVNQLPGEQNQPKQFEQKPDHNQQPKKEKQTNQSYRKPRHADSPYDALIEFVGKNAKIKVRGGGKAFEGIIQVVHQYQVVINMKDGTKRYVYKHAIDYVDTVEKEST